MTAPASFFVAGHPRTKGSARAFVVGKRAIVTNDNPRAKPWQGSISVAAQAAGVRPLAPTSAAWVELRFFFARPRSHYGTGKNAATLKAGAPARPVSHALGDIDKITRVVLDALTGVAYNDDAQVARLVVEKCYADASVQPGVNVRVTEWL